MIVRRLGEDRLLCIHQTTHALMAADLCRHWGNADFAPPDPYAPVLTAVSQHDNGWYEWEEQPGLRDDGYPMDFVHGPAACEKLRLWQRGIARMEAQHPYAALLIGEHAARLYRGALAQMDAGEAAATRTFIDEQAARRRRTRADLGDRYASALTDDALARNTDLLQFGDTVSLQLCMPWGPQRTFSVRNRAGDAVALVINVQPAGDPCGAVSPVAGCMGHVTVDPWPFGRDDFVVGVHGRLLARTCFAGVEEYHAALTRAPIETLAWRFLRNV